MANYNKAISEIVSRAWEDHAAAGHWPEAKFSRGPFGVQFMLFERGDSEKAYFYAINEWLKAHNIPEGIFTKKRNESLLNEVRQFVNQPVLRPADLKVGQTLKLKAIRGISTHFRQGEIESLQAADNIINLINCVEQYGYQDTYGSCYFNEVVLVGDENGNWRVFEP